MMRLPADDRKLIQIMDASLADAARRAGPWLACKAGCTQCCYGAFAISQLDALRLRDGMSTLRASDQARAAAVEVRAKDWMDEFGPDFPGDLSTGLIGESDVDRERFEAFANDAPCPALDLATGLCDLYDARPMTCRVFGPPVRVDAGDSGQTALAHCELCFIGPSQQEIAACEMPLPSTLEEDLIAELASQDIHGETVVAFALLR